MYADRRDMFDTMILVLQEEVSEQFENMKETDSSQCSTEGEN